jgi:hypothetical protein
MRTVYNVILSYNEEIHPNMIKTIYKKIRTHPTESELLFERRISETAQIIFM